MKINRISYNQTTNFTAKKAEKTDAKEKNFSKNSKKVLYTLAGMATIAAAGVGAVYAVKHLRKPNAKNLRQFFDKAGVQVKNVNLKDGKAISSDGTVFSGIMKTINKKGNAVELEYANGLLASSTVDGNLLKKYTYRTNPLFQRSTMIVDTFAQDGKTKVSTMERILTSATDRIGHRTFTQFNANGSIAKTAAYNSASKLEYAKVFNPDGSLARHIVHDGKFYTIEDKFKRSSSKVRGELSSDISRVSKNVYELNSKDIKPGTIQLLTQKNGKGFSYTIENFKGDLRYSKHTSLGDFIEVSTYVPTENDKIATYLLHSKKDGELFSATHAISDLKPNGIFASETVSTSPEKVKRFWDTIKSAIKEAKDIGIACNFENIEKWIPKK